MNTSRPDFNPFANIKRLNERKDTPIVYCTIKERDAMVELAKATGWPEWKGVFIAFYTGMRREEVANLLWSDINFDSGTIKIRKTKIGKPRTIPLPTTVEKFLEIPRQQGHRYSFRIRRIYVRYLESQAPNSRISCHQGRLSYN